MNINLFDQRMLDTALRNDLVSFIHKVTNALNPGAPYRGNWHATAVAWHLVLRQDSSFDHLSAAAKFEVHHLVGRIPGLGAWSRTLAKDRQRHL